MNSGRIIYQMFTPALISAKVLKVYNKMAMIWFSNLKLLICSTLNEQKH